MTTKQVTPWRPASPAPILTASTRRQVADRFEAASGLKLDRCERCAGPNPATVRAKGDQVTHLQAGVLVVEVGVLAVAAVLRWLGLGRP